MRICLVICLVMLLSIAPAAQAQDNRLPRCSDAALAALAEIQPAYEALIADLPAMSNQDSFVPYIEANFSWREQLLSQLPLCGESLEIGVLMDRIASNLVAIPALNSALASANYPEEWNPYNAEDFGDGSLPNQLARQLEAVAARLDEDARVSPAERVLPACTDGDYDIFYDKVFDPYFHLIETFSRGRNIGNLLRTVESALEWRGNVWHGLPACAGMVEITWLMSQAASDLAVFGAFNLASMKTEADLFNAEIARNSAAIAEMTPAFLGKTVPDATPPVSTLPGCAHSQRKDFFTIIMEYAELANAAAEVASFDDVLALGQRQFDWREERLSDAPRCAEALELSLLIDQSTSDVVLVMALLVAGVEEDDIPHMTTMHAGSARLSALVTPILQGERAGADAPLPPPLPQCTAAQLAQITTEIERDFWAIVNASSAAKTIEDLRLLGEMQIAFRESIWSRLPACAEVYDIAWLMYRVTSDDVLTWALLAAGADEEDIPQSMSTRAGIGRLNTMLAEIPYAAEDADD